MEGGAGADGGVVRRLHGCLLGVDADRAGGGPDRARPPQGQAGRRRAGGPLRNIGTSSSGAGRAGAPPIGRESASRPRFLQLGSAPVKNWAIDSAFERALSAEIAGSELLRMRVLAATLTVLLVAEEMLFLFARDLVERIAQNPLPAWLPAEIIGPFLAYEIVALFVLHYRLPAAHTPPHAARVANAIIETSLPTVSLC